jgi:polysaccharide biosynthesis/export protein
MTRPSSRSVRSRLSLSFFLQSTVVVCCLCLTGSLSPAATITNVGFQEGEAPSALPSAPQNEATSPPRLETADDWNRRLRERLAFTVPISTANPQEYRIGSEDVLDINVFEAQEMNREVRVSASGEISFPLLGAVRAAGLTPRELEMVLQELLHQKYMKDPHVGVFVHDMQSHPVSVMGAVRRPGVFQIRGSKTLLEVLSLAEGLADDAGEFAIILRGAALQDAPGSVAEKAVLAESLEPPNAGKLGAPAPALKKDDSSSENVVQVNLKVLLESRDPRQNPVVYPGDIVKVTRAGIVYVVGAVQRPGGFAMKTNEKISVLQAIALSQGLTHTAAKGSARIIRTDEQSGARTETPIDLGKIFTGKVPDQMLGPKDIVFVPDSAAKSTFSRGVEAAAQTLTGLMIFHW